jgi:N6-L-threonylcarbamoyladenine synthase
MKISKASKSYCILAIDTSCDETSAAVTIDDCVISNVISSQVELHRKYGGVVPILAQRAHRERINPVITEALLRAQKQHITRNSKLVTLANTDSIAVTQGPGLAIALEIGIAKAKDIAKKYNKPLIAINHMEGHLLSSFAKNSKGKGPFSNIKPEFPILGLLVSGGHTQLVLMMDFCQYRLLGETLDDAAGEAFDKLAKMLDLGYPGGPMVSKLAKKGDPNKYLLPIPMERSRDLNFSFSGLKTAALYLIKQLNSKGAKGYHYDICASFERSLVAALMIKLDLAIQVYKPKQIVLGGGVVNNLRLRVEARKTARKYSLPLFLPYSKNLNTDNAAMIGVAAYYKAKGGKFFKNLAALDRLPNLNF